MAAWLKNWGPVYADIVEQSRDGTYVGGSQYSDADTGAIGEEITDPEFFGDSWNEYRPAYDLKTKDDEFLLAEDKLNDLIELLTGNPTQAQLEAAIDIPSLLKAQAVNVFLGMWDDYWRNGNNYYLFFDEIGEKWFFVPYDYDITFFDSMSNLSVDVADAIAKNATLLVAIGVVMLWNFFANRYWTYNDVD